MESSDSLTILASNRRDSPRPWLCWTSRLLNSEGSSLIDYFFAWSTGVECGEYVHRDDLIEQHLYSSTAFIHAGPGPILFADNYFLRFLLSDLNGSMHHVDPDWALSDQHFFKWRVTGRDTWCGRDVLVLRSLYWEGKPDYLEVWVTGAPDYLILRRESHLMDAQEQYVEEVTALGKHEGLVYPAAARLIEPTYKKSVREEHEYKVTSITRLDEDDRKAWRPAVPEGTWVMDNVRGKRYQVPYPPEREQALRQELARALGQHAGRALPGGPSRGPAFYFNVAMLVVFAMAIVIYRYKRHRRRAAAVS